MFEFGGREKVEWVGLWYGGWLLLKFIFVYRYIRFGVKDRNVVKVEGGEDIFCF